MSDAPSETHSPATASAITMVFGFERTNIHAVAEGVARVLNIQFQKRESHYTGSYYKYPPHNVISDLGFTVQVQRNQVKWEEYWNEPDYKAYRVILRVWNVELEQVESVKAAIHKLRKNPKTKGVFLYQLEQKSFSRDERRAAIARIQAKEKGQPLT